MATLTRFLEGVLAIIVAGLLWALASVPVVTMVPATVALYAVMVAWNEHGRPPVWSTFWSAFRRYLKQALWFTVLLAAAWFVIVLDLRYGLAAEGAPLRSAVTVAGLVGLLFLSGVLVFFFPVMVRFPGHWRRVLRNAGLFAAAYVFSTLLGLLVFGFGTLVFLATPWLLPVVAAGSAFLITRITGRCFDRYLLTHDMPVEDQRGETTDDSGVNGTSAAKDQAERSS